MMTPNEILNAKIIQAYCTLALRKEALETVRNSGSRYINSPAVLATAQAEVKQADHAYNTVCKEAYIEGYNIVDIAGVITEHLRKRKAANNG